MKKTMTCLVVATLLAIAPTKQSQAQIGDILRAIIIAADIAVQKVQNATIGLQNAQKQVENVLSKVQLGEIGDWEQKIKDLYTNYFQELWKVKTVIAYYQAVTTIISRQRQLVGEYNKTFNIIRQDKNFTAAELAYIQKVYSGILSESVKNLDEINTIVSAFSVQMTDAARLKMLNDASSRIEKQIADLRSFGNEVIRTSLQRSKTLDDINTIRSLYGL